MVDKVNLPPPSPQQFLQPGQQGTVNWNWHDWFFRFEAKAVSFPSGGKWKWTSDIDFTGSNLTDIQTRNHNDLQNIQHTGIGLQTGSTAEQYHLTYSRSQWPIAKKIVASNETVYVESGFQLTLHVAMTNSGIVNNQGELWIDYTYSSSLPNGGILDFSTTSNSGELVLL